LVDVSEAARAAVELIQPGLPEKVALRVELGQGLPAVGGDRRQIERLVIDLCLNARDAMPQGGTLLVNTHQVDVDEHFAERCLLFCSRPGPHVVLVVRDTGAGITQDDLHRIFEPFYTTRPGGHGLGLSAVHGIVSAHQGAIAVVSRPGQGTVFRIYFPVAEAEPQQPAPIEP
jgi:two-component system cell cycle sensor histidine kinase/response regulator CckA